MTPAKLRRRITFWQKTLGSLGLQHWRLSVEIVPVLEGATAKVRTSSWYDSAEMHFSQEYLDDCTDRELDETIVHELLHIAWRDYEHTITSVENSLTTVEKELWESQRDQQQEGLIERLARSFLDVLVH